jgi:type VI secretion system protein VasD
VGPGQKARRWLQRDPKARFVLAMGHFRQPLGYAWRAVTALEPVPEPLCMEKPAGDLGDPLPTDLQLRFRLQGYQIDLLRWQSQLTQPRPLEPAPSTDETSTSERSS